MNETSKDDDRSLAFIVETVSASNASALLAQKFEAVISANRQRGYALHSWKLDRVPASNFIVELIVAVFEREAAWPNDARRSSANDVTQQRIAFALEGILERQMQS